MHGPGAGTLLNAKIICEWTRMSLLQHLALAELFAAAAISCSGCHSHRHSLLSNSSVGEVLVSEQAQLTDCGKAGMLIALFQCCSGC